MESPITGKEMKLVMEPAVLSFRKEKFEVVYHYYLCEDSKEQFTDDVLDTINLNQVYNQYREKYGIPFPEEIREVREQYGVSASKMSTILGFGTNQYRLYETGEVPSVANGRLILAIKEPDDFIKQVRASEHLLDSTEVKKLVQKAEKLIEVRQHNLWNLLLVERIFRNESPNAFSGYRKPDFEKIAQVIRFLSDGRDDINKTKLNKLLFYADFGCFRKTGNSITGITYRAIPLGPVPAEYDKLYMKLADDDLIQIKQKLIKDYYADVFQGLVGFDASNFSPFEIEVLQFVKEKFCHLTTNQIVEISHDESAWIQNQENRDLINYQKYAFGLKHYH